MVKIKIQLLAAHASVKSYTYGYLRRHPEDSTSEYAALVPAFSKSSTILGRYWISMLHDYIHICLGLQSMTNVSGFDMYFFLFKYMFSSLFFFLQFHPFLFGIQSSLVSSLVRPCLDEAWPAVLQAVTLDSVPLNTELDGSEEGMLSPAQKLSGCSMVKLASEQFNMLWGFALLVLFFHGQSNDPEHIPVVYSLFKNCDNDGKRDTKTQFQDLKTPEVALIAILSLSTKEFYYSGMVSLDLCTELEQVLSEISVFTSSSACLWLF